MNCALHFRDVKEGSWLHTAHIYILLHELVGRRLSWLQPIHCISFHFNRPMLWKVLTREDRGDVIKAQPKPSSLPVFVQQHKLVSCHAKKCQHKIPDQLCTSEKTRTTRFYGTLFNIHVRSIKTICSIMAT